MSQTVSRPVEDEDVPLEPGPYTVEDFYRLVPDGVKADLLNGYIFEAVPDTAQNNRLTNFILILLQGYCEARDAGEVYASRFAFRLSPRNAPEPDVAYIAKERLSIIGRVEGTAAPDIAVEIVAKESRSRDYRAKFQLYEQTGVQEYWIIDPLKNQARFYRLQEGKLVEVEPESGIFRSEALPGFWLRVEWLLADPSPNAFSCLQEILAGLPTT